MTGGASGIGAAIVEDLVDRGASALAVDISESGAERVAAAGAQLIRADVADPAAWQSVVTAAKDGLGGLDLVVLNAGVHLEHPELDAPYDEVRRVTGVNLDGVVHGLRAAVPLIEETGGGDVLVVSSLAGLMPYPDDPWYATTKHAVIGLARSFAPSLKRRGVRLNVLCPGVVDTPAVPEQLRNSLAKVGLQPMPAAEAAAHVARCVSEGGAGRIWTSQAHMGLAEYVPAPVELPQPVSRS